MLRRLSLTFLPRYMRYTLLISTDEELGCNTMQHPCLINSLIIYFFIGLFPDTYVYIYIYVCIYMYLWGGVCVCVRYIRVCVYMCIVYTCQQFSWCTCSLAQVIFLLETRKMFLFQSHTLVVFLDFFCFSFSWMFLPLLQTA